VKGMDMSFSGILNYCEDLVQQNRDKFEIDDKDNDDNKDRKRKAKRKCVNNRA
jgi:tRNA A37 threonylcarbamoyltransferase TsaD